MAREEAEVAAGGRACSLTTVQCGATPVEDPNVILWIASDPRGVSLVAAGRLCEPVALIPTNLSPSGANPSATVLEWW
jgi:hypothetical protein